MKQFFFFLVQAGIEPRVLIQQSETLLIELTGTHIKKKYVIWVFKKKMLSNHGLGILIPKITHLTFFFFFFH